MTETSKAGKTGKTKDSSASRWVSYRPEIRVLDCTIRDGGLMNNHKFDDALVKAVYQACVEGGVDYMELGYKASRKGIKMGEHGPWKYCVEEDIRRIVGENEAQRLAGEHGLVDGGDLVGEWVDERGVDRQDRVEEMRQPDAVRFGDEAEECAVTVETPGATLFDDFDPGLVVPVEEPVGDSSGGVLVGELQGGGAEPLDADDGHQGVGEDAPDRRVGCEGLECAHLEPTRRAVAAPDPDRTPATAVLRCCKALDREEIGPAEHPKTPDPRRQ